MNLRTKEHESVNDEKSTGGVAAVSACARFSTLVLPKLIKATWFTLSHQLGRSVNRLVLRDLTGWDVFMRTPSLLLQYKRDGNHEIGGRKVSYD